MPNGYASPLPPLYDELFQLPENPRRAANRHGLSQAGLALLSSAGSRNYGQSLAQALGAWQQGRSSEMDRFGDLANRRQLLQARQESLRRQEAASEAAESKEMRRLEAEEDERRWYLSQIPEGQRGQYALAPTDAIKAAAQPDEDPSIFTRVEGNRLVGLDKDTGEEIWRRPLPAGASDPSILTQVEGNRLVGINKDTGQEVWSRPLPPEQGGGRQPGDFTAGQWFEKLWEEEHDKPPDARRSRVEVAREAEAMAQGENPNLVPGQIRPPSPGSQIRSQRREELGGASLGAPPPPEEPQQAGPQGAPRAAQVLSALPDEIRDTPGLAEKIADDLKAQKSPQEILDEILEAARRAGRLRR